jgi:hypothetical protein
MQRSGREQPVLPSQVGMVEHTPAAVAAAAAEERSPAGVVPVLAAVGRSLEPPVDTARTHGPPAAVGRTEQLEAVHTLEPVAVAVGCRPVLVAVAVAAEVRRPVPAEACIGVLP